MSAAKDKTNLDNAQSLVEVLLHMPHTHAGRDYLPGDIIKVTPAQHQRLAQLGIVAAKGD